MWKVGRAPWPVGRVPRQNPNPGTIWESAGARYSSGLGWGRILGREETEGHWIPLWIWRFPSEGLSPPSLLGMLLCWLSLGLAKHWELLYGDLRQRSQNEGDLGVALISRALQARVEGWFPSFQANPFWGIAKTQLLLFPPTGAQSRVAGTGNNGCADQGAG